LSDGRKFFENVVYVILALVFASAVIWQFAQVNPLFAYATIGGGGVFLAIVAKAKGVFDNVDFSLSDLTDIFRR